MRQFGSNAVLIALSAAMSLPTYAQPVVQGSDMPTLHATTGVVMANAGAQFVPAASGARLSPDQRLMVSNDSSAAVVYKNNCQRTYDKPGVYTIEPGCNAPAPIRLAAISTAGDGVSSDGTSSRTAPDAQYVEENNDTRDALAAVGILAGVLAVGVLLLRTTNGNVVVKPVSR